LAVHFLTEEKVGHGRAAPGPPELFGHPIHPGGNLRIAFGSLLAAASGRTCTHLERRRDVEMAARVRARELRLECKPSVHVAAWADSPAWVESGSERANLPDELEPGLTYRNFEIRWRAAARLKDPNYGSNPDR
jgi:hypothetical protein